MLIIMLGVYNTDKLFYQKIFHTYKPSPIESKVPIIDNGKLTIG